MFKKRRPYKKALAVVMFLLALTGVIVFLDRQVRPTLFSIAEVEVTQMAIEAINKTVQDKVTQKDLKYQDFITVQRDYNGRVALMQANTVKINQMAADITLDVQKRLKDLNEKKVSIPLGQMLGSYIFADWGPSFNIAIHPMGTVNVDVVDRFEQAGINQTRHKIYFSFNTMVKVVVPLYSGEVKVATMVPVAENIVVGDVPETVINFPGGLLGTGGLK
ncbi:sporulation protein YunB [Desulfotruncus alcoholivorax]|uniref:sporulation protein YunB n=1 Tax=Desulfotruncus alcoholivorax TaxID=265477 RepID=UPI000422E6EA|nr:sporulation protein YunB [Desulfotruncus alcoholivorax]